MNEDQELLKMIQDREAQAYYDALPIIDYATLKERFDKWLLIVDPGLLYLVPATIIANLMNSDPFWLFLIAKSGAGKTEIMNSLLKCPFYYSLSQLTPNTFLSGYKSKEKEPSLLKRLGSGKTIGFKDFTSLLDGNRDELKELMGQFRDLYDGHVTKVTGTGDEISWKGKMGFLAGCTPILEQRMSTVGAMGERFLSYKIMSPTDKAMRAKVRENIGHEEEYRDYLQDSMAGYIKGVVTASELNSTVVPEEVDLMIESLSDFIAISRTVVMRGDDSKREINYIAESEMSSRLYKQLYTLAKTLLSMTGGVWVEAFTYIMRNIARSSIHSMRFNLITHIMSYTTQVKTQTLATELGYPTSTTRRYLEDLTAISMDGGEKKILKRTYQGKGKSDLWELTPWMKDVLKEMGEFVEGTKQDTDFEAADDDKPVGAGDEKVGYTEEEIAAYKSMMEPEPQDSGVPHDVTTNEQLL